MIRARQAARRRAFLRGEQTRDPYALDYQIDSLVSSADMLHGAAGCNGTSFEEDLGRSAIVDLEVNSKWSDIGFNRHGLAIFARDAYPSVPSTRSKT